MTNIIREAFQKVKIDITDLKSKFKSNEDNISKINQNILTVKKDYKENLDNVYGKIEEMFDYLKKENKELKRQLTVIRNGIKSEKKPVLKKEIKEEPLYEAEEVPRDEDKRDKKKGWFSKLVDFLAEEDDDDRIGWGT